MLKLLSNTAGVAEFVRPAEKDDAHYGRIFDLHLRVPLLAMQEAAKVMAGPGRSVNLSSGAAQSAPPGASVYAASKAALEQLKEENPEAYAKPEGDEGEGEDAAEGGNDEADGSADEEKSSEDG